MRKMFLLAILLTNSILIGSCIPPANSSDTTEDSDNAIDNTEAATPMPEPVSADQTDDTAPADTTDIGDVQELAEIRPDDPMSDDPVAFYGGVPEIWPDDIPIPPGLALQNFETNPIGGFNANFMGEGEMDEIVQDFVDTLTDWTETDSLGGPVPGEFLLQRSFYSDGRTFHIEAMSPGEGIPVNIMVFYNWYAVPGEIPDGWPVDVVVMPELEVRSGYTGPEGNLGLVLLGQISLQEVADFYMNSQTGWELSPVMGKDHLINETQILLQFDRGPESVVVNGFLVDDISMVRIIYNNYDPVTVQEQ